MSDIPVNVLKRTGRAFYQAEWTDPVTRKLCSKSTKTSIKRDADRFAAQLRLKLEAGAESADVRMTWDAFCDLYRTEGIQARGLSEGTSYVLRSIFGHVTTIVNPKYLRSLDTVQIAKVSATLREKGTSVATIKSYLSHLRAALRWALNRHLIERLPTITIPKYADQPKGRAITLEEFERMIFKVPKMVADYLAVERRWHEKYIFPAKTDQPLERHRAALEEIEERRGTDPPQWERLLWGLWWSGLRIGEALELHWRGKKIRPELSGNRPMFWVAADGHKRRKEQYFPMAPEFAEFLEEIPEADREGHVFDLPLDTRRRDTIGKRLGEVGKLANVAVQSEERKGKDGKKSLKTKFASAHDLRRSFCTRWAMRVRPVTLCAMARHESIDTTLKFYVRPDAEAVCDEIWATQWQSESSKAKR